MTAFSLDRIVGGIERCEQAGLTILNVMTNQKDYVPAEFVDIKTLARRISDQLDLRIENYIGFDGITITDVRIDEMGVSVSYIEEGVNYTKFFDDIVQVVPYSIENIKINEYGELLVTSSEGDITNKGRIIADDAVKVDLIKVNEDGTISITYTDESEEIVGDISNFSEDPVDSVFIEDGILYFTRRGESIRSGQVQGMQGEAGLEVTEVSIEKVSQTHYISAELSSGYKFSLGSLPEEIYSPSDDEPLGATLDDEGNLTLILYNGKRVQVGNVNAPVKADDGLDGVTVVEFDFRNEGTELHLKLSDSDDFIFVGVPQQITIKAETKIQDITITEADYLVFSLDIDGDGSNIVNVNMGEIRIKGKDGDGIDTISIDDNQDVVMTYRKDGETNTAIIGNFKYNKPKAVRKNPFGFIEIEHQDKTIVTSDKSVDASSGKAGLFVSEFILDEDNEYMATAVFSDDSVIEELGKLRPLQPHSVAVVEGEVIFTLANEAEVSLGHVEGEGGRTISAITLDDNEILIEYNKDEDSIEIVEGQIHRLVAMEYNQEESKIKFIYDDERSYDFDHEIYHGADGRWVTAMDIIDGELVITYNNEETNNLNRVDGNWITGFTREGNTLKASWNHTNSLIDIKSLPDYDGTHARYITDMRKDVNGDLVVTWNDESEEVIGRSDGRWITELYREGDDFFVKFNNSEEPYLFGSIESFDGDEPRWITGMEKDEEENLIVTFNDDSTENLGPINGADGLWIVDITNEDDDFVFELSDGSLIERRLDGFTGINGDWITNMIINEDRELVISYHLAEDLNLGNVDGLHFFNGIIDITYEEGVLKFYNRVDGVDVETAVEILPVNQVTDVSITDTTNLEFTTHAEVIDAGRVAGDDVEDGKFITKTFIRDGQLVSVLSNEEEILSGLIESNNISSVELIKKNPEDDAFSDLLITLDDETTYKFEDIVGIPNNEGIVDAYIDQQDRLVFTRATLDPQIVGQVVGDLGNGIDKFSIDELGFLHVHLMDETKIQVAYVLRSFGFKLWTLGSTFDKGQTAVFEGNAYVAISNDVKSAPSKDNPEWLAIRFQDEAGPEVASPICITPNETYKGTRPILNAGKGRLYYSVDKRVARLWELDTVEGDFKSPLYSASENLDYHQVEMDLEVGVEYVWRAQDYNNNGLFSDWGYSKPFMIESELISTPTVNVIGDVEANGGVVGVTSSTYSGESTHSASLWQVKRYSDDTIIYDVETSDGLTETEIPFGYVTENAEFGVRVQHINSNGERSSFSDWTKIKTISQFEWGTSKPTIKYADDMGNIGSTPARPRFISTTLDPEFHSRFMNRRGLESVWEIQVSDGVGGWDDVTTVTSMVDIYEFRPLKALDNTKTHRVRLMYKSSRFVESSEWSDWLEFATDYSISAPVISYTSDNIDAGSGFPILDMNGVVGVTTVTYKNDEARYYKWILSDIDSGTVLDTYFDYEMSGKIGLIYDGVCNISCVVVGKYSALEESNKISVKLNTATGFIGEVPASELFTGTELSGLIRLSQGTNINSDEPWLKFIIDGEIIYVAKKHYKHSVSWSDINVAKAVYDNETSKIVSKDGNDYRVTLMRGANTDPTGASGPHDLSEWDRLMYKVSENDPDGTPWASYTDIELDIAGRYTWCQETGDLLTNTRAVRGYSSLLFFANDRSYTFTSLGFGWRPVLRLINPSS